VSRTRRICVWSGGSEQTIFADREMNYAFHAWHDWTHYTYELPFTPQGERDACAVQISDLAKVFGPRKAARLAKFLYAEVVGQLEYQQAHCDYPTNQRAFVDAYLINPVNAINSEF
jgi:hypothetical protein